MWTRTAIVIVAAGLLLGEGLAFAQTAPGEAVEKTQSGVINWTTGWIKATGLGVAPPNLPPGQSKAMAERAAFAVALRNVLETVKGVRVDSETLVENYMVTNDVIRTQISGYVKGAQIAKTETLPDGGVEITVKVPLWGTDSIISPLMGQKPVQAVTLAPEPGEDSHTGLVIDARGLGLKPACFPEVRDEAGNVVYGAGTADRGMVEKHGLIEYRSLPKDANISLFFGEGAVIIRPVDTTPPAAPREGRRPLKIKGVNKAGALKANVLISSEDAKRIKADAGMVGALQRSKVIIVTDPLIGGMEGRLLDEDGYLTAWER